MDQVKALIENNDNAVAIEIGIGIILCCIIWLVVFMIKVIINKGNTNKEDSPILLSGLVSAKISKEFKQDPNIENSKTLKRSINENGIEYTYSFWMYISGDTWHPNNGSSWKHVLHKGPKINKSFGTSDEPDVISPIQSPGIWLDPTDNVMRLYVNTFETNTEYVEISNLPVQKWIHLVYTQSNFTSNVYINGRLKTSHNLKTLPRQNYYNLHLTNNDGFNGYLTTMQYFNYVLSPSTIYDLTKKGPTLEKNTVNLSYEPSSDSPHLQTHTQYLSNRWWVDDVTMN